MPDATPKPDVSRRAIAAVGLTALLILGAGGTLALGADLVGGPSDAAADATPTDASDSSGSSDDGGAADDDGGSASEETQRPFTLDTKQIEGCGNICRDVTVSITNNGEDTRKGIEVTTEMSAGGDRIWTGEASIGALEPGESTTQTKRVKVGFMEAAKIKQNGGTVTVETVVHWNGGSETYRERKQVA